MCKSTCTELRGAALVNKEELRLTDKYVKYLEEGHSKVAPAGGILLQAPARFPVSSWIALDAVRQSANLMCQRASIEPIRATPKVPYGRVLVCVEQGGVRALWSSVAFQDCKAYRLIRRAGIRIDELEGYVRKLHKKLLERCNELTNTVEQILRTSLDLLEELKWSSLMALSDDEQAEALMVLSTRAQRPTSTTL